MPETGYLGHKLLIIFITAFHILIYPQQYPDKKVHLLLKSGIENLIRQKYDSASKDFLYLKKNYSELPLGDIYLAAAEITKSFDLGIQPDHISILSHLKEAELKSGNLLNKEPDNLWNNYFKGLCEGYSAYYSAMSENWIHSFTEGVSALEYLDECLAMDSTFYESYTAIGTFKYWKSRKLESLTWLPFIEDETEEGIKNLKIAVASSEYNKLLAGNSLIWIYIDQKDFNAAIKLSEELLNEYPENRTIKWALGRALQETYPGRSIKIYQDILNSYNPPSPINDIVLNHKMAQIYYSVGNKKKALKLCEEILSKNITDAYSLKVLEERLQRVKNLYFLMNQ